MLLHYAHIYSLPCKQQGKQHWKTKQPTLSLSVHVFAKRSQIGYTTGGEKNESERKKTPYVYVLKSTCMFLTVSFPLPCQFKALLVP